MQWANLLRNSRLSANKQITLPSFYSVTGSDTLVTFIEPQTVEVRIRTESSGTSPENAPLLFSIDGCEGTCYRRTFPILESKIGDKPKTLGVSIDVEFLRSRWTGTLIAFLH